MIIIQQMYGRIGTVTGKGLAGVILEHYSRRMLYVTVSLLVIANTINIGADLGAMASSAQMLLGLPFLFWLVLITGSIIVLEVFVPYRTYSRILKYYIDPLLVHSGSLCYQAGLENGFSRYIDPTH